MPQYNYPPPYAGPYTGCLAYLLPYIEQGNVYQQNLPHPGPVPAQQHVPRLGLWLWAL